MPDLSYLFRTNQFDKLLEITKDASDYLSYKYRAEVYLKKEEYQKALEEAQKALSKAREPGLPFIYGIIGQANFHLGQQDEAVNAYCIALEKLKWFRPHSLDVMSSYSGYYIKSLEALLRTRGVPVDEFIKLSFSQPNTVINNRFNPAIDYFEDDSFWNLIDDTNTDEINNEVKKSHLKRKREGDDELDAPIKRHKKNNELHHFFYIEETENKEPFYKCEESKSGRFKIRKYWRPQLVLNERIEEIKISIEDSSPSQMDRLTLVNTPSVERFRLLWSDRLDEDQKEKINKIAQKQFKKFKEDENFGNRALSLHKQKKSELHHQGINAHLKENFTEALECYRGALRISKYLTDEYTNICYDIGCVYSQQGQYENAIWALYKGYKAVDAKLKKCESSKKTVYDQEAIFFLRAIHDNVEKLLSEERKALGRIDINETNLKSDFTLDGQSFCNNPLEREYRAMCRFFPEDSEFKRELEKPKFRDQKYKKTITLKEEKDVVKHHPNTLYAEVFAEIMHTILNPEQVGEYLNQLIHPPQQTWSLIPPMSSFF